MIDALKNLNDKEQDLILKAPAMIAILVAGADDDITDREQQAAVKWARYKRSTSDPLLMPYYDLVHNRFETMLKELLQEYPSLAELRNPIIVKQLEQLNEVLPKLEGDFAVELYESLKRYAHHIAEASGGFLGFFRINPEERKWLHLDMIKDPAK